jgi:hypothetical protein
MEFKYVALTMVIILICLFSFTPFFTKKEKVISLLEAQYVQKLQGFKNGHITKENVQKSGQLLARARGLKIDRELSMVENDLGAFSHRQK